MMITRRFTPILIVFALLGLASFAEGKKAAGINEYQKGNELFDQKQYDQAIAEFTKAIQADPKQAPFYTNRGFAYLHVNKLNEAVDDFTKAIELDEKNYAAYIGRAQAWLAQQTSRSSTGRSGSCRSTQA